LKKERFSAVHLIVSALQRFRDKTGAFTAGRAEQTMVWRDGESWCRGKVDWLPDEPSATLWDLKTSSTRATLRKWTRSAYELGTDQQAAFYCRGSEIIFGEPPAGMNFCVIETRPPFGLAVFSFSPAAIEIAEAKVRYALLRWGQCMADNRWPNYPIEPQWIEPPIYVLKEWESLTASGAEMQRRRESRQIVQNEDNLADRLISDGSFGG
jgi:hypothetical protein